MDSTYTSKRKLSQVSGFSWKPITVYIFYNISLQTNIREGSRRMNVQDNEVVSCTILIGDIPGYPKLIWYDPKGITNILSMTRVEFFFPITYGRGKYFIVNKTGETSVALSDRNGVFTTWINQHPNPENKRRAQTRN